MSLKEYERKRRFDSTPEPPGKLETKSGHRFVVQMHRATRLQPRRKNRGRLLRDLGAPLIRAQVFGVLRKNPEVTLQILHSILQFAVNSLMKLLGETNPSRFHFPVMCINIIEKNCQALKVVTEFRRRRSIRLRSMRHDVRVR